MTKKAIAAVFAATAITMVMANSSVKAFSFGEIPEEEQIVISSENYTEPEPEEPEEEEWGAKWEETTVPETPEESVTEETTVTTVPETSETEEVTTVPSEETTVTTTTAYTTTTQASQTTAQTTSETSEETTVSSENTTTGSVPRETDTETTVTETQLTEDSTTATEEGTTSRENERPELPPLVSTPKTGNYEAFYGFLAALVATPIAGWILRCERVRNFLTRNDK